MAKTEKTEQATEVVDKKEPGTQLVHWRDKMVALTKKTQEAEKPQGGFISFKGGRMTYNDELLPNDKINAIIVDYRFDNEFYPEKYDPKKQVSPTCFAITRPDEIQAPHADAEDPQNATCEGCIRNEWGSALDGGKGKACKTTRRLHIIAADDATSPEAIERASVMSMIPPATSVENFSTMMNQLNKVLDTAMFGAVVEISVKPHDRFLYQVHFKILQQIQNEELLQALMAKHEKTTARDITYPKNSEREGGGDPRQQSSKY